jgi:hypothetical protein
VSTTEQTGAAVDSFSPVDACPAASARTRWAQRWGYTAGRLTSCCPPGKEAQGRRRAPAGPRMDSAAEAWEPRARGPGVGAAPG